tara:strand:+ start:219 stop:764 length:546 start_codon:yes stop_codon:yes gene_type:complete
MSKKICPECGFEQESQGFELILKNVPKELFEGIKIRGARNVQRFLICSPFLTKFGNEEWYQLIKTIGQNENSIIQIITLPPENSFRINNTLQHKELIELYENECNAEIYYHKDLHAKIYVASVDEISFAIIGSANFTKGASGNQEAAILVTDLDYVNSIEVGYNTILQSSIEKSVWENSRK